MNSPLKSLQTRIYRPIINSLSGLAISVFNPFKKGDFIEIDGNLGSVENRGIRKTAIKTPDGSITTVENSKFYFKQLHNLSSENIIRLDLNLTVHLDTDMTKFKAQVFEFFNSHNQILSSPIPQIQVKKIQNQHVDIIVKPWCLIDDFLELDTKLEKSLINHLELQDNSIQLNKIYTGDRKLLAS